MGRLGLLERQILQANPILEGVRQRADTAE
jgi:hypothetical protein